MTCAECRAALSAQLDGEAGEAWEALEVDAHLAECAPCRDWLTRARRLQALSRAAPGPSAEWSERLVAGLVCAAGGEGESGDPG